MNCNYEELAEFAIDLAKIWLDQFEYELNSSTLDRINREAGMIY